MPAEGCARSHRRSHDQPDRQTPAVELDGKADQKRVNSKNRLVLGLYGPLQHCLRLKLSVRIPNSYGFYYIPLKGEKPEKVEEFVKDTFLLNKRVPWQTEGFPDYTPDGNFNSGPLTNIFPFLLYVGTVEELIDCIPDREIIDVAAHIRHYISGKVSPVKGYRKRKPIRANEVKDDITNCSIPDDYIDPRRSALFMARSVLRGIQTGDTNVCSTS